MVEYINWNGNIVDKNLFHISPSNRSFRYGDGFFETFKVDEFAICLESFHFERLFHSLNVLHFDTPSFYTPVYIRQQIEILLHRNNHSSLARVRLMVFRGDGGLFDQVNDYPNFVIQSWPLDKQTNLLNIEKLKIDIFYDARKTCDMFSSLKSNNFLCYVMAAFFVTKHGLYDALVLNPYGRIADSTTANIFIVQNGVIKTPPLTEGCISGIYRKYLLQCLLRNDIPFVESHVTVDEVLHASEVFLTNAVKGIRWIHNCGNVFYKNEVSGFLHNKFSNP